jgi:hypothetical protein
MAAKLRYYILWVDIDEFRDTRSQRLRHSSRTESCRTNLDGMKIGKGNVIVSASKQSLRCHVRRQAMYDLEFSSFASPSSIPYIHHSASTCICTTPWAFHPHNQSQSHIHNSYNS